MQGPPINCPPFDLIPPIIREHRCHTLQHDVLNGKSLLLCDLKEFEILFLEPRPMVTITHEHSCVVVTLEIEKKGFDEGLVFGMVEYLKIKSGKKRRMYGVRKNHDIEFSAVDVRTKRLWICAP